MQAAPSQDKILYQLKRRGPQTVRELSELLAMTTMGIRQHLAQLEQEGLVEKTAVEQRGRGRPVGCWQLSGAGHRRFPDAHAQVSHELIISVRDLLGQDALDKLIHHRTETSRTRYLAKIPELASLEDRISYLCDLRTAEGYMAEWEKTDGGYRLLEHHCPICIAARACQGFCQGELDLFRSVIGELGSITREDHLLQGARRCSYLISPC